MEHQLQAMLHQRREAVEQAVRVPLTTLSKQVTGKDVSANVVGLGVLAGLTGLVSREALEAAVRARVPEGTAKVNLKALAAGYEAAERMRA